MAMGGLPGGPGAVEEAVGGYLAALAAAQPAPQQGQLGGVSSDVSDYVQASPEAVASVGDSHPLGKLLGRFHNLVLEQPGMYPVPGPLKGSARYVQSYGGHRGAGAGAATLVRGGVQTHGHEPSAAGDYGSTQRIREEVAQQERITVCVVVSPASAPGQHRPLALAVSGVGSASFPLPAEVSVHGMTRCGAGGGRLRDGRRLLHGTCERGPPLVQVGADIVCIFDVSGRGLVEFGDNRGLQLAACCWPPLSVCLGCSGSCMRTLQAACRPPLPCAKPPISS